MYTKSGNVQDTHCNFKNFRSPVLNLVPPGSPYIQPVALHMLSFISFAPLPVLIQFFLSLSGNHRPFTVQPSRSLEPLLNPKSYGSLSVERGEKCTYQNFEGSTTFPCMMGCFSCPLSGQFARTFLCRST